MWVDVFVIIIFIIIFNDNEGGEGDVVGVVVMCKITFRNNNKNTLLNVIAIYILGKEIYVIFLNRNCVK